MLAYASEWGNMCLYVQYALHTDVFTFELVGAHMWRRVCARVCR